MDTGYDMPDSELLAHNVDVFKSTVNRYGLYGLIISLVIIVGATVIASYQDSGKVTLDTMMLAQQTNFALRILDLIPFVFAFWGQYIGSQMAHQASEIIMEETDDLREESTAWKKKSLHNTLHDTLTDLPNRARFYELLKQALHNAATDNKTLVILYINLIGLREFNDAFGHTSGDLIIKEIANRLKELVHDDDIVARTGGDKFILLLSQDSSEEVTVNTAKGIQNKLEQAYVLENKDIDVSVSIGVTRYPEDGEVTDLLVQRAELAMVTARKANKGYVLYSPDLDQDNPFRITLMSDLRQAINDDQLELNFQPKIDMLKNEITSVEALVRWTHPEHGCVSPGEFVPLAERGRLIKPLTKWVVTKAMLESAKWHKNGINIGTAINISTRDLEDPELPELFAKLLEDYDINPEWITIEITESSIMDDPKRALKILNLLSQMNFRLSIDDFGTGYSSLTYLSKLPVQELKIDQSFVMGMTRNKSDALIVKATIDLGHNLGLKVIAEGVENEEVWNLLKQMNCDIVQGYYFSPPLDRIEFFNWLENAQWKPKTAGKIKLQENASISN